MTREEALGSGEAKPPKVSIIMATYNSAPYVEAAIRSALDQTIADVEIIAVDDCSKDDTYEIVQRMAASEPRIKPFRMPANGGPGASRHMAVNEATGEWIAQQDSDDLMHPARLERLLKVAEDGGFDVVADNLQYVEEDATQLIGPAVIPTGDNPIWTVGLAEFVRANLPGETGFKLGFLKPMIRRSLLLENRINYQPHLRVVEDYQLLFDVLAAGAKFGFLNECLYDYRIRKSSGSHNYSDALLTQMAQVAQENLRHPTVRANPALREAVAYRLKFAKSNAAYVRTLGAARKKQPVALLGTVIRHLPYLPYIAWRAVRVPFKGRVWSGGAQALNPVQLGMKKWEAAAGSLGSAEDPLTA